MPNLKFKKPIDELEELLKFAGVPYERRELFDGYQICVPRYKMKVMASTICHRGSYGHEQGLLEFYDMGSSNEPVGFLSPAEAYEHIADYLDKNPKTCPVCGRQLEKVDHHEDRAIIGPNLTEEVTDSYYFLCPGCGSEIRVRRKKQ